MWAWVCLGGWHLPIATTYDSHRCMQVDDRAGLAIKNITLKRLKNNLPQSYAITPRDIGLSLARVKLTDQPFYAPCRKCTHSALNSQSDINAMLDISMPRERILSPDYAFFRVAFRRHRRFELPCWSSTLDYQAVILRRHLP